MQTNNEKAKLEREKNRLQSGDLYNALHHVGDDPVKGEIEDVLEEVLDRDTFQTVLAVFNLSTGWKQIVEKEPLDIDADLDEPDTDEE